MRHTLSAADAKKHLADALRQAESGDLVLITRYRKPVAALVGVERLEQLADAPVAGEAADDGTTAAPAPDARSLAPSETPSETPPPVRLKASQDLRELREWAAAGSLRRIEADLARMPERLEPAMRLIRANLFQPRFTVERLQAALGVGAHDLTTEFRRAVGVPIHRYLTDRRLEAAARLLVDSELQLRAIARLVGYSRTETLSRAFKRRYGVRPPLYRELAGRLSPEVASDARTDLPPTLPRCLAGVATVAAGALCGRCGGELEAGTALRVFEDLAPICDRCARRLAPELAPER